ncbi:MAG: DUF4115 domain-containing protein [Acidobacteriota bacterium]|nr:DUF4115 domain-containing protein [Acidobacteriota bacterium]
MGAVADELKAKRESLGLSLEQISEDTRINLRHLESLEGGRYDELPSGMYARAFLRTYCDILQLDKGDMLRRYEEEVGPPTEKPAVPQSHLPSTRRLSPAIVWGVVFLVSAGGIFFGREWITATFSPYFTSEADDAPPAVQRPPSPAPAADAARTGASGATGAPSGDAAPPEGTPEADAPSAATAPAPGRSATGGQDRPLWLEVIGKESCWLSVNSDDAFAFEDMLNPGDTKSFIANRKFAITVGNANGVQLKLNGRAVPPLGKAGQVVRLTLDASSLAQFTPPPAS